MANCSVSVDSGADFVAAVSYALAKLGRPELELKDEQKRGIHAVYNVKDVFLWLPTGFGKSICFQTLPFVFDHKQGLVSKSVVIIVSPLVALMVDQVQSLRDKGVAAVIATSGGREGRVAAALLATEENLSTAQFVYGSPEGLLSDRWMDILEKPNFSERVCAIVVDEAHCVSKW